MPTGPHGHRLEILFICSLWMDDAIGHHIKGSSRSRFIRLTGKVYRVLKVCSVVLVCSVECVLHNLGLMANKPRYRKSFGFIFPFMIHNVSDFVFEFVCGFVV